MRHLSIACVLLLVMTAPGLAQISAFWQRAPITPAAVVDNPQLANMQSWDLLVTTSGDWSSAGIKAQLPPAQLFFNDVRGGDTEPTPQTIAQSPAVEFDTYLTSPGGYQFPPLVLGGFTRTEPFSMGGPSDRTPGRVSASWGNLRTDPPGTHRILRATFALGVMPDVINGPPSPSSTSQVTPDATTIIPDIPEPAGLALFLLCGAATAFRRARGGR